jgi:hypothetical protein
MKRLYSTFSILTLALLFLGCAGIMQQINLNDQNLLLKESVDTFGYTLGLLAAKDPELKVKVESYYSTLVESGIDVAIVNAALKYLGGSSTANQILAYKMTGLIMLVGGEKDATGSIVSIGKINPELIEIGKNAYLFGLKTGGAIEQ